MGVILADISAFEYWRRFEGPIDLCRKAPVGLASAKARDTYRPWSSEIGELTQRGFAFLSSPVHIMVPDAAMRLRNENVVNHVCSAAILRSELIVAGHGIYVASPRLCLAQLASRLLRPRVARAAFELCGSYREEADGLREALPLVSPESLRTLPASLRRVRGSAALGATAKYVLPGSASPMESALVVLLCFPSEFGGYEFPPPVLNKRIDVGSSIRDVTRSSYFKPDLYWPEARLAVEYDSKQFHSNPDKIAADAARRNALLHMGIEVVTVSADQIMNAARFDEVAKIIGRRIGKRMRYRGKAMADKRYRLRRDLLDLHF